MQIEVNCKDDNYYSNLYRGKNIGESTYDVTIADTEYHDLKLKNHNCIGSSCLYWRKCDPEAKTMVRSLDCMKNITVYSCIYIFITVLVIGFLFYISFFKLGFGVFISFLIFGGSLLVLDFVFATIENFLPEMNDIHFQKKIIKIHKKMERIKKKEEAERLKKQKEEEKNSRDPNPIRMEIKKAKQLIQKVKELVEKFDFGNNSDNIQKCIERLEDVITVIEKNPFAYKRVVYLFQYYLPEFNNLLQCYSVLLQTDSQEEIEESEMILTDSVDIFLNYLVKQKTDVLLDKSSTKMEFKSRASTLKEMLGGDNT